MGRFAGRPGPFRACVAVTVFAAALLGLSAGRVSAVPSFAVQTGQPCNACHVGGFGPQLTPFGREFKMNGYTTRSVSFNVPASAMIVASYLRTARSQSPPPAPGYSANDNVALDQVSLFLAGGVGSHLGAFVQTTYDGVAKAFHWDNLDVRAVTTAKIGGANVVFGASLNNAPTLQDAFNTLPSWGYPYTTSSLAPAPGAAPLIGHLAQNTLGLTGYVWVNSQIYLEAGGYQSPGRNFLARAGVDPFNPGDIGGTAPYARIAYQKNFGAENVEVGAFGLWANLYPGRDRSAGAADHYADTGVDASFQYFAPNKDVFTVDGRFTHESQRLNASLPLGLAQNSADTLNDVRLDATYYWRNKIGGTIGAFDIWGSADNLLYAGNRTFKPDSSGLLFQLDGTPFGAGGSPFGPRFNMRVGVQYTLYTRFDGAGLNYDGSGGSASGNDTVRVFTWIAY